MRKMENGKGSGGGEEEGFLGEDWFVVGWLDGMDDRTKTREKRCSISCLHSFWLISICVLNCALFLNFYGEGANAMARELKIRDCLEPFLFSDLFCFSGANSANQCFCPEQFARQAQMLDRLASINMGRDHVLDKKSSEWERAIH